VTTARHVEQPRSDAIIDRLHALHPRLIDLSLDRLWRVLRALGDPHNRLPPVIHVAGTNGKGSTCAFLRAIAEAAGWRVHVYTSPHLVSFNERIRIAGRLVEEDALADALEEVERANAGAPLTVFEVITAAALHLFASRPAELCVLEVGLGGRFDATNVVHRPAACAIGQIAMDHRDFLGDTLPRIAFEKAGVMKPDVPCATARAPRAVRDVFAAQAQAVGARVLMQDAAWRVTAAPSGLRWQGDVTLDLPAPSLAGPHQVDNAGLAIAALRTARLGLPETAYGGIARAEWPARLQRLTGRLAQMLPAGEVWLDGGHNPAGGAALAAHVAASWGGREVHLIVGMKRGKDAIGFMDPLLPLAAEAWAVAEPGQHQALAVEDVVAAAHGRARPGPTVAEALARIAQQSPQATVLICGSLYLAGEVLKTDR
jgi:dihydrofolate synthase/folylpolyglutamate synthase